VSKAIAIVLMLTFACGATLPALLADSESTLPACCRRDGKHHCAMMDMLQQQEANEGVSVKAGRMKCPNYPKAGPGQTVSKTSFAANSATTFALFFSHPTAPVQTEARFRLSHSRTQQKRGPPSLLS